jgi:hypothetical protein
MKFPVSKVVFAILFISLLAIPAFAQDTTSTQTPAEKIAGEPALFLPQAKEIAIYGEVQKADAAAGTIAVQYYDYDSDSEKTAEIVVGKETKIENAASVAAIKKGDWVDVTYSVLDGKNAAKVVTVEQEEAPATEEAPAAAPTSIPAEQ